MDDILIEIMSAKSQFRIRLCFAKNTNRSFQRRRTGHEFGRVCWLEPGSTSSAWLRSQGDCAQVDTPTHAKRDDDADRRRSEALVSMMKSAHLWELNNAFRLARLNRSRFG
jgi:hypothetical protein